MGSLLIRDARPADLESLLAMTITAYEQYALVLSPIEWQAYKNDIIATVSDSAPAEQIVAELDGQIVGSVLLFPEEIVTQPSGTEPDTRVAPEIRLLAVMPSARGKGIATALIQDCMRRARNAGSGILTLHTTDMMNVAMQLYIRMGFQRAPELDFQATPTILIKGFRYDLEKTAT